MPDTSQQLAELHVDIDTRLDRYRMDLEKARGVTTRAGKEMQGGLDRVRNASRALTAAVRTATGVVAGLAAAGGLTLATKRALDFADSIDKTSERLGISVETLQELRFAADLAGVRTQALDIGFQRFTRRLAEARQGTGEALGALQTLSEILGEDLLDTSLSTEKVFGRLADAFASIEDPARRVQLAFKLFDSEGVALLQVLGDGEAALEAVRQKARELGIVMEASVIKRAVEAKDQITIMSQVTKVQLSEALIAVAPLLVSAASKMADLANAVGDVVASFQRLEDRSTRAIQRRVREIAGVIRNETTALKLTLQGFVEVPLDLERADPTVRARVQALIQEQQELLEELHRRQVERPETPEGDTPLPPDPKLRKAQEDLLLAITRERLQLSNDLVRLAELEAEARRKQIEEEIKIPELKEQALAEAEQLAVLEREEAQRKQRAVDLQRSGSRELLQLQAELLRMRGDEQGALEIDLELRRQQVELANIDEETKRRMIAVLEEINEKQMELAREGGDVFAALAGAIEETFSRAFASMVVQGEISFRALREAFVREFIEAATQELLISPLLNVLLGARGAGGQRQGGFLRNFGAQILDVLPRIPLPGFEKGGRFGPHELFAVGERGPEILASGSRGGSVHPIEFSEGRPFVVEINVTRESEGVDVNVQERSGSDRILVDLILNTVANDVALGGRVARAHEGRFHTQRRGVVR